MSTDHPNDTHNPFTAPGAPTPPRIVMYHHLGDSKDYPAIICEVRGIDRHGSFVDAGLDDAVVRSIEKEAGPIEVRAHLTVFRPNKVEWRWAVESEQAGGWSWPKRVEGGGPQ